MAPDFPGRFGCAQLLLEPRHLLDAEIGLWRLVDLRVGDFGFAEANGGGRAARPLASFFQDVIGHFRGGAEIEAGQTFASDGR
jgi:hypothetical protein